MTVLTDLRWTTPGTTPLVEILVNESMDVTTVPRLQDRLEDALRMRPERLVIDLAGCPFVDATALALLLDVHRRARRQGGQLVLRAPSPRVLRAITLTGLQNVFTREQGPADE